MGMVVIGGGGCLQTTAFPAEGVPLPSNASRAVLAHLRLRLLPHDCAGRQSSLPSAF